MTSTSPYYTCHYSVRPENDPQFLYKPNTKASVAAAVGANVIHSRDLSLKNLVPDDYPYYTDTDLESVQKMAKYAEETFDSEIFKYSSFFKCSGIISTSVLLISKSIIFFN